MCALPSMGSLAAAAAAALTLLAAGLLIAPHATEAAPVLVAGGVFVSAGGTPAKNIAAWDGAAWKPLGAGLASEVFDMTEYEGALYAAGWFPAYVVRWDADAQVWDAVGALSDWVAAIYVHRGSLFCGGYFERDADVEARHIAEWDGGRWRPVGSQLDGPVYTLISYGNFLLAGGGFETPGKNVAVWDGAVWSALGTGVGGGGITTVYAAAVYGEYLVVGGYFFAAEGSNAPTCIAQWDGVTWSSMGLGVTLFVSALVTTNDGYLIAGGGFSRADNIEVDHLARWDGAAWSGVAGGTSSDVDALAFYGGSLVVGGSFIAAGNLTVNRIAQLNGTDAPWSTLGAGVGGDYTTAVTSVVVVDDSVLYR